ncbi:hypothetical protein ACE1CD_25350 [Aerosakkonema sp. BLCC-F183]|uniref:hypothetical protein n=1 Tax=Aerosakkonema sp. BLCC-F183 TaxID=3342834 RepID=UPI0035B89991
MELYIDTRSADADLYQIGNWIKIRCRDNFDDAISAERISTTKVKIKVVEVAEANRNKGRGTALVQKLFDLLPSEVDCVVLGSNDAPEWWRKIKYRIRGGDKLVL